MGVRSDDVAVPADVGAQADRNGAAAATPAAAPRNSRRVGRTVIRTSKVVTY
jgi:hypothetical protein